MANMSTACEEARRLASTAELLALIADAVNDALQRGMSIEDVKSVLDRTSELLDEE